MKKQIMVISYFGDKINPSSLVEAIENLGVVDKSNGHVTVATMTEEEVLQAVAAAKAGVVAIRPQEDPDPVEKAILYIGMRFADTLVGDEKTSLGFTIAITSAIALARQTNSDRELLTAVEILATREVNPRKAICKKYGIDATVLNIIKHAFSSDAHTYGYVFG